TVPGVTPPTPPPAPVPPTLPPGDLAELVDGVRQAIVALPAHFTSPINIEGIDVMDLYSLNSLLGGSIEGQVVDALNDMRSIWGSAGKFKDCFFRRHAQSFPDVRLIRPSSLTPVMGIELKGWYL